MFPSRIITILARITRSTTRNRSASSALKKLPVSGETDLGLIGLGSLSGLVNWMKPQVPPKQLVDCDFPPRSLQDLHRAPEALTLVRSSFRSSLHKI